MMKERKFQLADSEEDFSMKKVIKCFPLGSMRYIIDEFFIHFFTFSVSQHIEIFLFLKYIYTCVVYQIAVNTPATDILVVPRVHALGGCYSYSRTHSIEMFDCYIDPMSKLFEGSLA